MTQIPLSIGETRAYKAHKLRELCFGWKTAVLCIVIPLLFGVYAAYTGNVWAPLAAGALLGWLQCVLHLFLNDVLEDDRRALGSTDALGDWLAADMLRHLVTKPVIDAGDLLKAATETQGGRFMLRQMQIAPQKLVETCRGTVADTVDVAAFLHDAIEKAQAAGEKRVEAILILSLFFGQHPACKDVLHQADLASEDLPALVRWEKFHRELRRMPKPWESEGVLRLGSIGRSWVTGYTDALDLLTVDMFDELSHSAEQKLRIHQDSIEAIQKALDRSARHNVLIIGPVGTGKRTLVENVARAMREKEKREGKSFTRVLRLKTQDLLSGGGSADGLFLDALNRAQSSGRILLVIRDFSLLLTSGNPNVVGVLRKFLEAKNISILGIANAGDYHSLVKQDAVMDSLFEKITITDAGDEDTMSVLMARELTVEATHGITVTYAALKSILTLCKRYLANGTGLPGKALDILEDAVQLCRAQGDKAVTEEFVRVAISSRSKVNVQKVTEGEKERLLNLEDAMRGKVIGQDAALKAVAGALRRARIDLSDRKKPVGTFLFLGPTGVGKTQAAKVLAAEYFGTEEAMIRLDMNEFSQPDAVSSIVGGGSAQAQGFLARRIQDKPFSLILLDEIEKAHPSVLNLFLQILDEGFLTDAVGNRTDFRNAIIIATSNAGALYLRDTIKEKGAIPSEELKKGLIDHVLKERMFSPEFLNRFDEVVLFYPLTPETATKVASLMIGDIIRDIKDRRGIKVEVEDEVLRQLSERGYSIEFGAREMRRTVTEIIEDHLANYLLKNDVKRGDTIVIKAEDIKW